MWVIGAVHGYALGQLVSHTPPRETCWLTVLGGIHLEFALAGAVAPRCLLALGEQVPDCLLALPYLLLLLLERFRVQELAAFAGFAAKLVSGATGQVAGVSEGADGSRKAYCELTMMHAGLERV